MGKEAVSVDVLVVGTGASGMAAAITAASQGLKVLVVEKEASYGGTTARSGGGYGYRVPIWRPIKE